MAYLLQYMPATMACRLVLSPFILWADPPYSAGTNEPTATPLPRTFHALIDISFYNTEESGYEVCLFFLLRLPAHLGTETVRV
jgi:hypothetical protein